jgi:hypothetical protein
MDNLKTVMDRLFQYNLKIQLSNTKFYVTEVKVLGVIFSAVGKKVDPEKVKAHKIIWSNRHFKKGTVLFRHVGISREFHSALF